MSATALARAPFDRALWLVAPATLFMLALFIYPFVYGLILSFQPKQGGWLANYAKFFNDGGLFDSFYKPK